MIINKLFTFYNVTFAFITLLNSNISLRMGSSKKYQPFNWFQSITLANPSTALLNMGMYTGDLVRTKPVKAPANHYYQYAEKEQYVISFF